STRTGRLERDSVGHDWHADARLCELRVLDQEPRVSGVLRRAAARDGLLVLLLGAAVQISIRARHRDLLARRGSPGARRNWHRQFPRHFAVYEPQPGRTSDPGEELSAAWRTAIG